MATQKLCLVQKANGCLVQILLPGINHTWAPFHRCSFPKFYLGTFPHVCGLWSSKMNFTWLETELGESVWGNWCECITILSILNAAVGFHAGWFRELFYSLMSLYCTLPLECLKSHVAWFEAYFLTEGRNGLQVAWFELCNTCCETLGVRNVTQQRSYTYTHNCHALSSHDIFDRQDLMEVSQLAFS